MPPFTPDRPAFQVEGFALLVAMAAVSQSPPASAGDPASGRDRLAPSPGSWSNPVAPRLERIGNQQERARQAEHGGQPLQAHPQRQGHRPGRGLRPQALVGQPAGGRGARPAGGPVGQDRQEPAGLQEGPHHPDGPAAHRPGRVRPRRRRRLLRLRAPGLRGRRGVRHRAGRHPARRAAPQQHARPGHGGAAAPTTTPSGCRTSAPATTTS